MAERRWWRTAIYWVRRPWVIVILLGLIVLVALVGGWTQGDFKIVRTELAGTLDQAESLRTEIGTNLADPRGQVYRDFLFIPVYTITLIIGSLWAGARFYARGARNLGPILAWGSLGAGCLDVVENIGLLMMLAEGAGSGTIEAGAAIATAATGPKWILIFIIVAYFVVSQLQWLLRWRGRAKTGSLTRLAAELEGPLDLDEDEEQVWEKLERALEKGAWSRITYQDWDYGKSEGSTDWDRTAEQQAAPREEPAQPLNDEAGGERPAAVPYLDWWASQFDRYPDQTDLEWAEKLFGDTPEPFLRIASGDNRNAQAVALHWVRKTRAEVDRAGKRREWRPEPGRRGIAFSGGGIRAATYCLGALQALTTRGELRRSRYLAAVSGGGYIASAYATVTQTSAPAPPLSPITAGPDNPWVFQPGSRGIPESPEMTHVRNNSMYLLPTRSRAPWAIWRLLLGFSFNLFGIALIIYLVSLPVAVILTSPGMYEELAETGFTMIPGAPWALVGCVLVAIIPGWVYAGFSHGSSRARALKNMTALGISIFLVAFLLLLAIPYLIDWALNVSDHEASNWLERAWVWVIDNATSNPAGTTVIVTAVAAGGTVAAATSTGEDKWTQKLMKYLVYLAVLVVPILGLLALVWMTAWNIDSGINPAATAAVIVTSLIVFVRADIKETSLHPFYRRRLASGYRLRRDSASSIEAIDEYDLEVDLEGAKTRDLLSSFAYDETEERSSPELIMCGTVNISDVGATPTGRDGASFTFSGREIRWDGSSIRTRQMERLVSHDHRRTLSLDSVRAIIGAAVSPGMGKRMVGMWPFRSLLALGNVRLGVWMPNPSWVANHALPASGLFRARPRFSYLFREMFGIHRQDDPFLYVTDGGHWEVLGLVELLRRGCTMIYCFDASGDDVDSFTALTEAMMIARADLGVEFTSADLDAMRPAPDAPAPVISPRDHLDLSFRYPNGVRGTVVFCKAAVTDGASADVKEYQRNDPRFPSHSTGDQLFDHEQFEAYRKLGHDTASNAVATMLSSSER